MPYLHSSKSSQNQRRKKKGGGSKEPAALIMVSCCCCYGQPLRLSASELDHDCTSMKVNAESRFSSVATDCLSPVSQLHTARPAGRLIPQKSKAPATRGSSSRQTTAIQSSFEQSSTNTIFCPTSYLLISVTFVILS